MTLSSRLRKLVLMAHIVASVGWLGAVAAFLALAFAGLIDEDAQRVRAMYLAMDAIGWFVIVPLCVASFVTGLFSSLGTAWGLFRQYWVLLKLSMTVLSTVLLLVHMQPISHLARIAAAMALSSTELRGERIQIVIEAGVALVVLLVATALSVYKPKGMTPYGWRKQRIAALMHQR